jgi:predicted DNA-binding protein YlxM (UPF0122 family)
MGDKTLMMTMLLDFYGDMLTPRQQSCFSMYYNEDLSLAEIAEQMQISRQGVRDLIVRAEAALTEAEEKIGLVRRFSERRPVLDRMETVLRALAASTKEENRALAEEALSLLERLRD